jgi:hypothetical protein
LEASVRFISLGRISSKEEFDEIVTRTRNQRLAENQVRGFADLLTLIDKTERGGFNREQKRWTRTEQDAFVLTFAGPPDANRLNAIWAAVRIQSDNRALVLLKLVDDYSSSPESYDGLLADAIDRNRRGTLHD